MPSPLAAATIAPVDGRMATSALAGLVLARVFSASFCSPTFSVVVSGLPGTGLTSNNTIGSASAAGDGVGEGLAELPLGFAAANRTRTPGVPRSCASYRCCNPESPTWSPATTAPPDLSTSSLAASPTVPMMGRAKSRVGASIWLVRMESAPGMARIREPMGRSAASIRSTMARTKASLPAAATSAAYAFGSILTTFASRIADALALSPLTFDLSIPIRNTDRSSTIGTPSSPSSSPRSGLRRRCDSRFVPSSWGCTMPGCHVVFH